MSFFTASQYFTCLTKFFGSDNKTYVVKLSQHLVNCWGKSAAGPKSVTRVWCTSTFHPLLQRVKFSMCKGRCVITLL